MPLCSTREAAPPDWFPLRWALSSHHHGLQGNSPLPWWGGGWYQGPLREQLLQARRGDDPGLDQQVLAALVAALHTACPRARWQLAPIPCRSGSANGLPARLAGALAEALGWPLHPELLERSRHQRPQHGLGRRQRWLNQRHSFRALVSCTPDQQLTPVLLVDDVLTSGATALAARTALQGAGWCVAGLACLARTPHPRWDLRGEGVL